MVGLKGKTLSWIVGGIPIPQLATIRPAIIDVGSKLVDLEGDEVRKQRWEGQFGTDG